MLVVMYIFIWSEAQGTLVCTPVETQWFLEKNTALTTIRCKITKKLFCKFYRIGSYFLCFVKMAVLIQSCSFLHKLGRSLGTTKKLNFKFKKKFLTNFWRFKRKIFLSFILLLTKNLKFYLLLCISVNLNLVRRNSMSS